jgi:hypothetical protein
MMNLIPLADVPSQTFTLNVAGEPCSLSLYQKFNGFYLDLYQGVNLIVAGAICQNLNPIIRCNYLGLTGDFMFIDNQGLNDPRYPGIGSRFQFFYLP